MASIDEILERADVGEDGKYYFQSLTEEERNHLRSAGINDDEIVVDKNYKVGQERDRTFKVNNANGSDEVKKAELSADLQKSYDFWNKFNESSERTGVSYNVENVENKCLLVEAKKGDKTVFKGIDHGSKGFDVIKKDNSYEQPFEFFDLLVKKAKTTNPKTVIRIKDNVTDPVLRNKILVACAKNNATPVGNLPKGFDFEELKALVRRTKSPEELNELINGLYMGSDEYVFGSSNTAPERSNNQNNAQPDKKEKDNKGKTTIVPVIAPINNQGSNSNLEERIAKQQAELARLQKQLAEEKAQKETAQRQAQANQAAINQAAKTAAQETVTKREGWFKRNLKKGLLYVTLTAAVLFGFKKCDDKSDDKRTDAQTELLTNKMDDLKAENCKGWTNLVQERDSLLQRTQELERDLDDCAKKKVAPVKKKPVQKKKPVVTPRQPVVVNDTTHNHVIINDTTRNHVIINDITHVIEKEVAVQPKKQLNGKLNHEIDPEINSGVAAGTVTQNNNKKQLNSNLAHEINNETYNGFMETLASLDQEQTQPRVQRKRDEQAQDTTLVLQKRRLNSNIH